MSRKKNRKKNFVKQIAVVNKTPVKQEEQMVQLDLGPRRSVAFIVSGKDGVQRFFLYGSLF